MGVGPQPRLLPTHSPSRKRAKCGGVVSDMNVQTVPRITFCNMSPVARRVLDAMTNAVD